MKSVIVVHVLVVAFGLAFSFLVGGVSVQYVVEFWAGYVQGVPVDVPFTPCAVAGILLATPAIPAALATWVLSFIL